MNWTSKKHTSLIVDHFLEIVETFRDGWKMRLTAFSSTRMVETCRIALAFDKANLLFTLSHKESYAQRLQGEDWVGVLPKYYGSVAYGWHEFPREFGISDSILLDWIFEDNRKKLKLLRTRLKYLVQWLPEKITAFI